MDALHVPGASRPWPPFAQTTARPEGGPWRRASAPDASVLGSGRPSAVSGASPRAAGATEGELS
jgi:hypothetical protein